MVDLQNDEYKVLQPEGMIFIIRRRIQSYDHRYVLVSGSNLRIFDFQAEEYVYETSDFLKFSNNLIAASPVEYEFVYSDHYFPVGSYYFSLYYQEQKVSYSLLHIKIQQLGILYKCFQPVFFLYGADTLGSSRKNKVAHF